MSSIQIVLAASNLGSAALCVLLALPMVRRKVKPNPYYGVRFRCIMDDDEKWYAANEYGGRRLIFWSVPVAAAGIACLFLSFEEREALALPLGMAPMLYLIGAIESYVYARRL